MGKKFDHSKIYKLIELGASNEDIIDMFGVSKETIRIMRRSLKAARDGDLNTIREFLNKKPRATYFSSACAYVGIPDEVIFPKIPEKKELPVNKEAPASSATVHSVVGMEDTNRLISMLLDEQKQTNELLIQFMETVIPHYYEKLQLGIDTIIKVFHEDENANTDILTGELKKQTDMLDKISKRLKG